MRFYPVRKSAVYPLEVVDVISRVNRQKKIRQLIFYRLQTIKMHLSLKLNPFFAKKVNPLGFCILFIDYSHKKR